VDFGRRWSLDRSAIKATTDRCRAQGTSALNIIGRSIRPVDRTPLVVPDVSAFLATDLTFAIFLSNSRSIRDRSFYLDTT
jgi:hypothetical protein